MSITIIDPALVALLLNSDGTIELRNAEGRVLGQFKAEGLYKLPPGVKSPFTEEQLQELRKDRTGRPLKDILRDLKERE